MLEYVLMSVVILISSGSFRQESEVDWDEWTALQESCGISENTLSYCLLRRQHYEIIIEPDRRVRHL